MAGRYDYICEQFATFSRLITWTDDNDDPVNLTGYSADMQVRDLEGNLIITLTSGDGITLGGAAGTIALLISASETGDLTPGTYLYDLLLTSGGGETTRLLEGNFVVSAGVTQ